MNLAIKGHQKKGKKVIEILEMLGGKNSYDAKGDCINLLYILCDDEIQYMHYTDAKTSVMNIFTLEEFDEKFPYKVGDKVNYVKYNDEYPSVYTIQKMWWNGVTIEYLLDSSGFSALTKDLQPYKEETMEEKETMKGDEGTLVAIDLTREIKKTNEIEVILGDYEFVLKEGKTYFVKKNKYPKTYAECCDILGIEDGLWFTYEDIDYNHINPACISNYRRRRLDLYHNFERLIICRDAYWKIAGEQMGLGKPWDSRYGCGEWGYWIGYSVIENKIDLQDSRILVNHILVFPTEEMRDMFYENFKDLIENCKELL